MYGACAFNATLRCRCLSPKCNPFSDICAFIHQTVPVRRKHIRHFPLYFNHMHQNICSASPHRPRNHNPGDNYAIRSQCQSTSEPQQNSPIRAVISTRGTAIGQQPETPPHMEHDRSARQPIKHSVPPQRPIKRDVTAAVNMASAAHVIRHSIPAARRRQATEHRPRHRAVANQHSEATRSSQSALSNINNQ